MRATVRVADIAQQVRGVSYGQQDASDTVRPGYLPVLRAGNITDEGLSFDDLVFVPAERIGPKQRIRKGDVVIAASSGSIGVVGKAARALDDFDGGFGAFCKVLRPSARVDPRYFAHYFKTRDYRQRISRLAGGININNIRNEHLDNLEIPLPAMEDQARIADILDRAEALRAKRRAALAQLEDLIEAIFLEIFGDAAANPRGWPRVTISDVFDLARGGSPRPIDAYLTDDPGGVNWIMIGDTTDDSRYVVSTRKRIRPDGARRSRWVKPGDFLLTNSMSFGRPYISQTTGCVHDGWLVLSPKADDVDSTYFYYLLSSKSLYREFERRAAGATVKNLNIDLVKGVPIPIAPFELQREFARRVEFVEKMKRSQGESLVGLKALFASLQHRAFRGEL